MSISPHPLTQEQYNVALYQLLLMLEESGTPKTDAYTDGKGIPTIGVGINLRAAGHIAKILKVAFNIQDTSLNNTLQTTVNKTWGANLTGTAAKSLDDELNKAMADYQKTHPSAPTTFSLTEAQIQNIFKELIPDFSADVSNLSLAVFSGHQRLHQAASFCSAIQAA